ncbi:MAG: DUF4268 domain-containing protein [Clostridia bacterium]|nr:DUF4268 domain-containing protein [Clostridia bacterium]MBR3152507.1 DUF4268 domain-containing protein [Clostridia bacterium]
MGIGKLKEVDIRELWKHEQYDFSDWLSKKDNIENLNEILGLTLVDISKETYVGAYRCDLFAKDETTGTKVIIENQLEISNHDHLGKIITYASGLDAKVVVWIVKEAREEHRSAIEWLNNNTNNKVGFFLIEIHAYKIGDSDPAPMFQIVEQPNDFIKNNKSVSKDESMNKSQSQRLEFWNQFNDVVIERGKPFNVRKATTDHWYDVAIGRSDAHISITLVNRDSLIGVALYMPDNKDLYDKVVQKKEIIEDELGFNLSWERLDNYKASQIIYRIDGLNFDNHENYNSLMNQVIDKIIKMRDVFRKYI